MREEETSWGVEGGTLTHSHTHARVHARTLARSHARSHTHRHTHNLGAGGRQPKDVVREATLPEKNDDDTHYLNPKH